jgi:hypothetical protein
MGRTLATPTTVASNSGEVPHMATVAKSVNMASPSADKINGWEDKVEGVPAELCAIGFGQRCNDDGSCMRQGRSGDDGACVRFGL